MPTTIPVTRPQVSISTALINALANWLEPNEGETYNRWSDRFDAAVNLLAEDLDAPDLIERLEKAVDPISTADDSTPSNRCPDCDEAFYTEDDRIIRTECFHCGWSARQPVNC